MEGITALTLENPLVRETLKDVEAPHHLRRVSENTEQDSEIREWARKALDAIGNEEPVDMSFKQQLSQSSGIIEEPLSTKYVFMN